MCLSPVSLTDLCIYFVFDTHLCLCINLPLIHASISCYVHIRVYLFSINPPWSVLFLSMLHDCLMLLNMLPIHTYMAELNSTDLSAHSCVLLLTAYMYYIWRLLAYVAHWSAYIHINCSKLFILIYAPLILFVLVLPIYIHFHLYSLNVLFMPVWRMLLLAWSISYLGYNGFHVLYNVIMLELVLQWLFLMDSRMIQVLHIRFKLTPLVLLVLSTSFKSSSEDFQTH